MIIFFVQAACVPKGHNITVLLAEYFNKKEEVNFLNIFSIYLQLQVISLVKFKFKCIYF